MVIGLVGLAVLAGLVLAAFRVDDLPLIGGGGTLPPPVPGARGPGPRDQAAASGAPGALAPGTEVRVAGVRVGTVKGVNLARHGDTPYVRVDFRLRGLDL